MKRTIIASILAVFLLCPVIAQGFSLSMPLDKYTVSSPFGIRPPFMMGGYDTANLHRGVDLYGVKDSKVLAAGDGVVVRSYARDPVYGNFTVIQHWDPYLQMHVYTLYGHMKSVWVGAGDVVKRGDPVGIQGTTGVSTGPHVHFEILFDPIEYLAALQIESLLLNYQIRRTE